MAVSLVPEFLWVAIRDLLPVHKHGRKGGRPWVDDRKCLTGIVFVLKAGCAWNAIPRELGCGSGPTCWRRFAEWTRHGVWKKLYEKVLKMNGEVGQVDWLIGIIDS